MREIKVRGFAVEEMVNSQWIIGTGVHTTVFTDEYAAETGKKYEHFIFSEGAGWVEVHGDSIGQYTGLTDKNGVEIYEGDVYHQGDPNITYTVVWHDTGLIGKQNGSSSYAGLSHWQDRIEVIGNIHDNLELLEAAE